MLTCTTCEYEIHGEVHRDSADLPYCEECYEDLRRGMPAVEEEFR